jgi:hypothetical protein
MTDEPFSAPFVERTASKERAERLNRSGEYSQRREIARVYLWRAGSDGLTWRELGEKMGLHHGQVSGLLSSMHGAGDVFALRTTRNRCHPYVLQAFREQYEASERVDEPATTAARRNREIAEAARRFVDAMRTSRALTRSAIGSPMQEREDDTDAVVWTTYFVPTFNSAARAEFAALVRLLEGGEGE